jgi:hypothetical protein
MKCPIAGAGDKIKPARLEHGEGGRGDLAGGFDVAGDVGRVARDVERVAAISPRQAIRCSRARARLIGGGVDKRGQTNGPTWRGGGWNAGGGAARMPAGRGGVERERGARVARVGAVGGVPPSAGLLYVAPPSRGQRGMVLVNDKAAWYDAVVYSAWCWYISTIRRAAR